jgi:hypothetical protein
MPPTRFARLGGTVFGPGHARSYFKDQPIAQDALPIGHLGAVLAEWNRRIELPEVKI